MQALHQHSHGVFERLQGYLNAELSSAELGIWFYPRKRTAPLIEVLTNRPLRTLRVAASHFRDPMIARILATLADNGTRVEVLCHESLRRVPIKIERLLSKGTVRFNRYRHADDLPMHNKFMLLEGEGETSVLFGSFNLTRTSRWLNHEVLLKSSKHDLVAAFFTRWREMHAELLLGKRTV